VLEKVDATRKEKTGRPRVRWKRSRMQWQREEWKDGYRYR
jgi:hypothetical protein